VIPRKDVLFWLPLLLLPILGIKSPQTPILGSLIGFFKLIAQNIETCILSKVPHRVQQNLHNTKDNQVLIVGGHVWGGVCSRGQMSWAGVREAYVWGRYPTLADNTLRRYTGRAWRNFRSPEFMEKIYFRRYPNLNNTRVHCWSQ